MKQNIKTALITGSARRIGKYLAISLAKQGYNLAISYRNSKNAATELKEYLTNNFDIKAEIFYANLEEKESVVNLSNQVMAMFGDSLTLLINNASIFNKSQFLDDNFGEELISNFNTHLFAPVILANQFIRNVKNRGLKDANIVNIIDKNIIRYNTAYFYYLLSKKSLAELTKMLAIAVAPFARVNAIAPGFIFNLEGNNIEEENNYLNIKKSPLNHQTNPEDIWKTLQFLLENQAITGQIVAVDSGAMLIS